MIPLLVKQVIIVAEISSQIIVLYLTCSTNVVSI